MPSSAPSFHLRLYVAGGAPRSLRAVESVSRVCARHLAGRYELDVVDVYRQPELAAREGVRGVPALVRVSPPPMRRIVGDLGDESKLCSAILEIPT
ncbi:MAG: circadian clock KaiB family protein [Myxococcales bacterium]|nr:circadian clock KaiB family protein [Myxococcales bacterium]